VYVLIWSDRKRCITVDEKPLIDVQFKVWARIYDILLLSIVFQCLETLGKRMLQPWAWGLHVRHPSPKLLHRDQVKISVVGLGYPTMGKMTAYWDRTAMQPSSSEVQRELPKQKLPQPLCHSFCSVSAFSSLRTAASWSVCHLRRMEIWEHLYWRPVALNGNVPG
jgi:hypothetical protein